MTIDLHAHPLGTLFTYQPPTNWCRDGQAELKEWPGGKRYLVDTYWASGTDDLLSTDQILTAQPFFDPTAHRTVSKWEAPVYPDGVVVTITRQHGCYRDFYVPIDTPELTAVDRARYSMAEAERELFEAIENVHRKTQHRDHMARELARVEAAA
jgi:hypothetical protein